jgi:hypothetical protein
MFKYQDYTLIDIGNLRNGQDIFYYLWTFLFLPVCSAILFSAPIFIAFKLNNGMIYILIIAVVWVAEYFFYTYMASPADMTNGLYNALIGLGLFVILFFKRIISLFKSHDNRDLVDRLLDT